MSDEVHSINVYPNDKDDNSTIRIVFEDKPTKDAYIKGENKACQPEYADYLGAFNSEKVKETRIALQRRRMKHATQMGYGPKRKGQTTWYLISKPVNIEIA